MNFKFRISCKLLTQLVEEIEDSYGENQPFELVRETVELIKKLAEIQSDLDKAPLYKNKSTQTG